MAHVLVSSNLWSCSGHGMVLSTKLIGQSDWTGHFLTCLVYNKLINCFGIFGMVTPSNFEGIEGERLLIINSVLGIRPGKAIRIVFSNAVHEGLLELVLAWISVWLLSRHIVWNKSCPLLWQKHFLTEVNHVACRITIRFENTYHGVSLAGRIPSSCFCFSIALLAKIRVFWTGDFFARSLCCSWTWSRLHSKSLALLGRMTHTLMDLTLATHLPGKQQEREVGWDVNQGMEKYLANNDAMPPLNFLNVQKNHQYLMVCSTE